VPFTEILTRKLTEITSHIRSSDQVPANGRGRLPLQQPAKGRRLAKKPDSPASPLTAEQRLLLLDTWQRSGLPAGDFAPLVGMIDDNYPSP